MNPPWTAYRAFMSVHLIAHDKHPGFCPVRVKETWRHLFAKTVIKVTVPEATMACQDDQMCDRLKARIDGTVHGIQAIWDKNLTTEDWGYVLVDTKKLFNEIN